MPHTTPLIRFGFNWSRFPLPSIVPRIPIKFIYHDGSGQEKITPIIYAVLDSGADAVTIPLRLAKKWNLQLKLVKTPVSTAGGKIQAYSSKIDFIIGQAVRTVRYADEEICVLPGCPDFLVGIIPIFKDYDVHIKASDTRYVLEPRH
jgi:hypothetical protein